MRGALNGQMAVLNSRTKSHLSDLNRGPAHYECAALPTELRWQIKKDYNGFR